MQATMTPDDMSEVIERKLNEHREKTFRNGRPPKVGLDLKALMSIAGLVITILMIAVGLMMFVFQTRIEASKELNAVTITAGDAHAEIKRGAAVAKSKAETLEKRVVKNENGIRRLEHNVIQIGERVGARRLKRPEEP